MGQDNSKELQIMQRFSTLESTDSNWEELIDLFLEIPVSDAFFNMKADIKPLNSVCDLLSQIDQPELQVKLFLTIQKLLQNRNIFAQVSKNFDLGLLLEIVFQAPKQSFKDGLDVVQSVIEFSQEGLENEAEIQNKFAFFNANGIQFLFNILKEFEKEKDPDRIIISCFRMLESLLITRKATTTGYYIEQIFKSLNANISLILRFLSHISITVRLFSSQFMIELLYDTIRLSNSKENSSNPNTKDSQNQTDENSSSNGNFYSTFLRNVQKYAFLDGAILYQLKYAVEQPKISDVNSSSMKSVKEFVEKQNTNSRLLIAFFCFNDFQPIVKVLKEVIPFGFFSMYSSSNSPQNTQNPDENDENNESSASSYSISSNDMDDCLNFEEIQSILKNMSEGGDYFSWNLIWNSKIREEWCEAINKEIMQFVFFKQQCPNFQWDGYFPKILPGNFPAPNSPNYSPKVLGIYLEPYLKSEKRIKISNPLKFMDSLFDFLLFSSNSDSFDHSCLVLKAMKKVFEGYEENFIGNPNLMKKIVFLLKKSLQFQTVSTNSQIQNFAQQAQQTNEIDSSNSSFVEEKISATPPLEQEEAQNSTNYIGGGLLRFQFPSSQINQEWLENLLLFLKKLLLHNENMWQLMNFEGIPVLFDHLSEVYAQFKQWELENTNFYEKKDNSNQIGEDISSISQNSNPWTFISIHLLAIIEQLSLIPRCNIEFTANLDYLQTIVQTMSLEDKNITNQVTIVLTQLLISNPSIHSVLFKTGVFEFLTSELRNKCSLIIALFLKKYHNLQNHDSLSSSNNPFAEPQIQKSYLDKYFPRALVRMLDRDNTGEQFAEIMNTDIEETDSLWSKTLRERTANKVKKENLVKFMESYAKNPKARFSF